MKLKTIIILLVLLAACAMVSLLSAQEHSERGEGHGERERGEHSADIGGEGHGEEDSTQLKLSDTYDVTKGGAHLVLNFDPKTKSFKGKVKNVSEKPLDRVRVEVHYTKRFEIGPTKPGVLEPGASRKVILRANTNKILSWNTHAEIGNEEHSEGHAEGGEGREGRGEHGARERREGRGEHGAREGREGRRESREGRGEHGGREGREGRREGRRERGERSEGHGERERGEHSADLGGEGEGEEDGTQLKLSDTYDVTKNGAHLTLKWDPKTRSFNGVVKNVTKKPLDRVRVEVHYTRRFEIGPTKPGVLKPGESRNVILRANTNKIVFWNTHAEIGNEEHGEGHAEGREGREGRGEHGARRSREGRGEHGARERREGRREGREGRGEHGGRERGEGSESRGG